MDLLTELNRKQSDRVGEIVIAAFESGRAAAAEENALLRAELYDVKRAWRDLWEKAGRPGGNPEA
jgi:hypothetical protein